MIGTKLGTDITENLPNGKELQHHETSRERRQIYSVLSGFPGPDFLSHVFLSLKKICVHRGKALKLSQIKEFGT